LRRALAKDPDLRPSTAGVFLAELEEAFGLDDDCTHKELRAPPIDEVVTALHEVPE
jgi:hypothetical protein